MLVKTTCKLCNVEFSTHQAWLNRGRSIFCSRKCFGLWFSENKRGINGTNWKGGEIEQLCAWCNKKYTKRRKNRESQQHYYCSIKCKGKSMSIKNKGVANPNWRGDTAISTDNNLIRSSKQYQKWKNDVFIRDNFTCKKCGKRGGFIHAHHIKKFSIILNDIRQAYPLFSIQEVFSQSSNLWDMKNGITLCIKCHKQTHIDLRLNGGD